AGGCGRRCPPSRARHRQSRCGWSSAPTIADRLSARIKAISSNPDADREHATFPPLRAAVLSASSRLTATLDAVSFNFLFLPWLLRILIWVPLVRVKPARLGWRGRGPR